MCANNSISLILLLFSCGIARADTPATHPTERLSFLDNGTIRLGVDLDLGGAITWLSKSGDTTNVVNSWDWGRQVQMSFYSGPVPFTPDGKQPADVWRKLGWNPIQCGDHFKNRAAILDHRNDGKEIFVQCRPMQWPLNNVPGDCLFESRLTLDGNTVHATCKLINQRLDSTQYAARGQELPAIYTNGPWWRLMTYTGDKPFTNGELTQIPAKMPWSGWNATENWAALVDDKDWGLGIWTPGTNRYIGGFAGKPGAGGPKDNPCGYIAPNQVEILDKNIEYTYSYALILGSLDEIRKYACDHADHTPLPDYHFDTDRQHWYYHDAVDTGWPIHGQLDITMTGNDVYFVGPLTFWKSADAPKVHIEAAFEHTQPHARIRWQRFDKDHFLPDDMVTFQIKPDDEYHVYDIDLAGSSNYTGAMTGLRLDAEVLPDTAGHVRIKSISLK